MYLMEYLQTITAKPALTLRIIFCSIVIVAASGCSSIKDPAATNSTQHSEINTHQFPSAHIASDAQHDTVWSRMQQDLELEIPDNPYVSEQLNWLKENRRHIEKVSQQATPYLYYIVEAADKRDVPVELALIPLLESSYNPYAGSASGPHGLWQIVPGTARTMGLRQTSQYDERRDIEASTDAALDMLAKLNQRYDGDWLLTLAAYNRGPLSVDEAIEANKRRGKPTDFWSLKMPSHTVTYVSRLLALSQVVAKPNDFGVALAPIENSPYFAKIPLKQGIIIKDAAKLAQVDESELRRLNAGLKPSSRSTLSASHLLVPADRAEDFTAALSTYDFSRSQQVASSEKAGLAQDKSSESTKLVLRDYKVRSGETWAKLAKRYNMTTHRLAKLNNSSSEKKLQPGQKILIPASADNITKGTTKKKIAYKVKRGDSIGAIADRFGVSIEDIKRWNANVNQLKAGQQLTLWSEVKQSNRMN